MCKAILVLLFLSLPSTLWASDPFLGTWELNVSKSKFPSALLEEFGTARPKQETIVVRELNDDEDHHTQHPPCEDHVEQAPDQVAPHGASPMRPVGAARQPQTEPGSASAEPSRLQVAAGSDGCRGRSKPAPSFARLGAARPGACSLAGITSYRCTGLRAPDITLACPA